MCCHCAIHFFIYAAACHQGGRNVVISEKTLDKDALEKYLDGGFSLEAIVYQVGTEDNNAHAQWG